MNAKQVAKKRSMPRVVLADARKMQKVAEIPAESDELVEDQQGPYEVVDLGERQLAALDSGYLTDVTILVGDEEIKCHSVIVSMASPKLAAIIKNETPACLPGVNAKHFRLLLQIIYIRDVEKLWTDKNVTTLLAVGHLAHELEVPAVVMSCAEMLLSKLRVEELWRILDFAKHVHDEHLEKACFELIRCQADLVLQTDGFLACNLATLEAILQQDVLFNVTELQLFQACVAWSNKTSTLQRRAALASALCSIRFRLFSAKDFVEHVCPTGLLRVDNERDILRSFVADENFMPKGFSASTTPRDPVGDAMDIAFTSVPGDMHQLPTNVNKFSVFSVDKNIFILGVKMQACRAKLPDGGLYDENVCVCLKQTPCCSDVHEEVRLRAKVRKGDMLSLKFRHPIEIECNSIYSLEVIYAESDEEKLTYTLYSKMVANHLARIDVFKVFLAPPNLHLILADKKMTA